MHQQVLGPTIETDLIPVDTVTPNDHNVRKTTAVAELSRQLNATLAEPLPPPPTSRTDDAETAEARRKVAELQMDHGYAEVVATFFTPADPKKEAGELRAFLKSTEKTSAMSYGQVADLVGEAQDMAMRAAEMLSQVAITEAKLKYDADLIEATLRERAQTELRHEMTTKPSLDDIAARMKRMFSDEMKALTVRREEAKQTMAIFTALYSRLHERGRDLRQILARVQRPGEF